MKNYPSSTLLLFLALLFIGCSPRQLSKSYNEQKVHRAYMECIGDAAKPQPWEVTSQLVAIKQQNPDLVWKEVNGKSYILVSSWKADTTYYKNDPKTDTYNTGKYPIWVTVIPELQGVCQDKKFGRKEGLDLRLKQLLGLPPTANKTYFIEFWVRPQDLFRPCLDSKVAEVNCGLAFPEYETDQHKQWINDLRLDSYYNPVWNKNYPWTQLGYTYDWHPKNKHHVGLSEFVIGKNKDIIVHKIYSTAAYCGIKGS
ncbi:MAG: hypothetical protein AAGG75_04055 [Bacteroidota bacterium]